jgi:hypothetical protein
MKTYVTTSVITFTASVYASFLTPESLPETRGTLSEHPFLLSTDFITMETRHDNLSEQCTVSIIRVEK